LPADLGDELATATVPTLSHIGRYALKQPLGQGGLGTVYEAWDPLLSRTVAVKTLQFNLDTPTRVSLDGLFLNEARLAAGLNHPGIVTIFDAGLSAHGVYIAMERLRGRDLRQALAAGWRPDAPTSALLARRVADALAYAQGKGVVHCDIKPGNIFITHRERPKLLDFGIARVAHSTDLPGLEGLVSGSPHYLAPEQLLGQAVDGRTDLYSLGVVLYELLTSRKAFDGATLRDITEAVLNPQVPAAHTVNPDVAPELSAIVAKAMARQPADRFRSAAELGQALRRWLARQATSPGGANAPPACETPRPRPAPIRRRTTQGRWVLVLTALAVAAAVALFVTARRLAQAQAPVPAAAATPALDTGNVADNPQAGTTPGTLPAAPAPVDALAGPSAPSTAASTTLASPAAAPTAPNMAAATATANTSTRTATTRPLARSQAVAPRDTRLPVANPAAPPVQGVLQLAISPWGQVEVDGQPVGTTPPLTRLNLPEGQHTVTLRNEDFPPHTVTVQVSGDKPVTVRHRFGS
jgi:serine/threonine-protein kinase